ncbi:uncharacterized protein RBU57_000146 [Macrochelys suwanniensis]
MSAPHRNPVLTMAARTVSAAPEHPSMSKEPWHRTTPALIPQRRRSMSPTLSKQTPGLAPPPAPLQPQPIQDHPAKSFGPVPALLTPVPQGPLSSVPMTKAPAPSTPAPQGPLSSVPPTMMPAPIPSTPVPQGPLGSGPLAKTPAPMTPVPQGPSSSVAVSSPVCAEVELMLPSTPDTFSAARDLIAMTEPAPHQPSVPQMRIAPSRGKPAMLCPVPHAGISRRRSRSRSRSQSRTRHRSQSRHSSQSRHRSSSRRRSYLRCHSKSTSRHGRHYYGSRSRSRSRGWSQRRSPDDQSHHRSPRRSLTRSRLGSRSQSRSRHLSPLPWHSTALRCGLQGHSAPPWPSRSASQSSRAGSGYYMDQGHVIEGPGRWQVDMQDSAQGPQQWPFWTPMAFHQSQGVPSRASQSAHSEPWVPEATVSCPPPEVPEPAVHSSAEAPDPEAGDLETAELPQQDLPQDPLVPGLSSSSSSPDETVAGASSSGPPPIDLWDHQDLLRRLALNMNLQVQYTIQNLPFDGQGMFSKKTDSRLQTLKDGRTIIRTLPFHDTKGVHEVHGRCSGFSSSTADPSVPLGLLLNVQKSTLKPTQRIDFIGAVLDSTFARAFLPEACFQALVTIIRGLQSFPTSTA